MDILNHRQAQRIPCRRRTRSPNTVSPIIAAIRQRLKADSCLSQSLKLPLKPVGAATLARRQTTRVDRVRVCGSRTHPPPRGPLKHGSHAPASTRLFTCHRTLLRVLSSPRGASCLSFLEARGWPTDLSNCILWPMLCQRLTEHGMKVFVRGSLKGLW